LQLRPLIVFVALVASVCAVEKAQITAEMRAKFWRAQAEYIAATVQAQRAKAALDSAQAEMQKACGEQPVVANSSGDPECGPMPPAK
jgi:hypothetical protein